MGDDSLSRGHGFESWRGILDGHDILHIELLWGLYCLFEKIKNKLKEAGVGHFLKKCLNLISDVTFCCCFEASSVGIFFSH